MTGPTHGTLAFKPDGSFTYLSNTALQCSVGRSTDTFTYHDTDSAGAVSNTATVTINVINFDIPPVASPAPESTTTTGRHRVQGHASGRDRRRWQRERHAIPLTYSIVAGSATHGTVTLVDAAGNAVATNTTGAYVFTPTPNYGTNSVGSPIVGCPVRWTGDVPIPAERQPCKFSSAKTVTVNITPVDDGPGIADAVRCAGRRRRR